MAAINEQEEFEFRLRAEREAEQQAKQAQPEQQEPSGLAGWNRRMGQTIADVGAGAIRGAGSIGSTILAPLDYSGVTGMTNTERRRAMDETLRDLGINTESLAYGGGKIAAEIAGTAGMGGTIAKGLSVVPAVARSAPGFINAVRTGGMTAGRAGMATRMAGGALSGGAMAGAINPEDAGTGMAIGAAFPVVGKLAGEAGKYIGGKLGERNAAQLVKSAKNAPTRETLQEGIKAGYVVPPSYAGGGTTSRLAEGLSGKYKTNQAAGIRNQQVTDSLARKAVGLHESEPLTSEAMQAIRKKAYTQGYEPVGNIGTIATDTAYADALRKIEKPLAMAEKSFPTGKPLQTEDILRPLRVNRFNSGNALSKIQNLRNDASAAYAKGDNVLGKANRDAAEALEDVIQRNLEFKSNAKNAYAEIESVIGKRMPSADFDSMLKAKTVLAQLKTGKITHQMAIERIGGISAKSKTASNALSEAVDKISLANNEAEKAAALLDNFKASRVLMAKAHTVENAIKEGSGHVDAMKLASRLQAGKPLSGELETIGKFANVFRDVARIPASGDAVPFTALDFMQTGLSAPLGIMAGGPAGATAALALPASRIAARQAILSRPVQQSLARNAFQPKGLSSLATKQISNNTLADLLENPALRALPIAAQSR